MQRAANLFAVTAACLLIVGFLLTNVLTTRQHMSVKWPGSSVGYIIGFQVPCYGLAGLFAAFACLYALNYIPFNEATVEWHLWLSLVGAALFGLGFTLFAMLTPENTVREPSHGALVAAATGLFVGPALFTATQLLFVMALIHGVLAMRHR